MAETKKTTTTLSKVTEFSKFIFAAGIPGPVEACLNYPLITLKNYKQINKPLPRFTPKNIPTYYRGLSSYAACFFPYKIVMIGFSNALQKKFKVYNSKGEANYGRAILASGLAGVMAATYLTPFESLQTIGHAQNITPKESMQQVRQYGFRNLYNGYVATVMRDILYTSILFGISIPINDFYEKKLKGIHPLAIQFASGLTSGLIVGTITVPLDQVRTRMQGAPLGETPSTIKTFKELTNLGVKGIFNGGFWRIARIALGGGYILLTKHFVEEKLGLSLKKNSIKKEFEEEEEFDI